MPGDEPAPFLGVGEILGGLLSCDGPPYTWGWMMKKIALLLVALVSAAAPAAAQIMEYYHLDAIGNVRAVTDQAGSVIERHDYLPFGEECTTGPCASNPGITGGQPKHFTSKERDTETGFDYFGARYYGSKIGRFTTTDPAYTISENLVDPQRWNRYAYGRNNPLRYVDPDGRADVETPALAKAMFPVGANVRGAVGEFFMMGSPNQPATFLVAGTIVDFALATVLPKNQAEYKANVEASMFGMATPLAVLGERAAAITMEEAVARGAQHVGGEGVMEATRGGNFQFRRTTTTVAGETETRMSRFDVNPASAHVKKAGPHLNTEVHINGEQVSNVHAPIDPKTVRPGDHP